MYKTMIPRDTQSGKNMHACVPAGRDFRTRSRVLPAVLCLSIRLFLEDVGRGRGRRKGHIPTHSAPITGTHPLTSGPRSVKCVNCPSATGMAKVCVICRENILTKYGRCAATVSLFSETTNKECQHYLMHFPCKIVRKKKKTIKKIVSKGCQRLTPLPVSFPLVEYHTWLANRKANLVLNLREFSYKNILWPGCFRFLQSTSQKPAIKTNSQYLDSFWT